MVKLNERVKKALFKLADLNTTEDVTIMADGKKFQIYHKAKLIADNLTLTDLRNVSRNALTFKVVQLVDVSHLIFEGHIKSTDGRLKIKDDVAYAMLHVIKDMKFQEKPAMATQKMGVAV